MKKFNAIIHLLHQIMGSCWRHERNTWKKMAKSDYKHAV